MSADIYEYRDDVLATLRRLADAARRDRVEAERKGDRQGSILHQHRCEVLDQAVMAVRSLGRE